MYTENRTRSASVMMRMFLKAYRAFSKLNFLFHRNKKNVSNFEKM